jgi:hypothetical protein
MTVIEFRKIALGFPDAVEASHMNHPDFRVFGKIFASLGYPNKEWGMVKLTPDQQADVVKNNPKTFVPVKGAWGLKGGTNVNLPLATKATLSDVLEMAWTNIALNQLGIGKKGKQRKSK